MVFNHTAVFPEELWPRQIVTNGSVTMQGAKMSKSFGNIIPLIEAIATFGADPLRLGILATAELLQDADFSPTLARSMRDRLERLYKFAEENSQTTSAKAESKSLTSPDRWMLSRLQERIKSTTESMDRLEVRKAIHSALYQLDQDFQWYNRRIADQRENPRRKEGINYVFREILDAQVRMLAPATPHICEEIWEKMRREGFVSNATWPIPNEAKVDVQAEENEALIEHVLEDTLNIMKATGITPSKICYYVSAQWKWKAFLTALQKSVSSKVAISELMKELMKDNEMKKAAKQLAKFAGQITDEVNYISAERKQRQLQTGILPENQILKEAESFLKREFNADIYIYLEEDKQRFDPKNKASFARPCRPAIYIE
jgi:leucyl-tRNA synthetase